jgi:hypothetical protein
MKVCAVVFIALLIACGSSPSASPTPTTLQEALNEAEQHAYDGFLSLARDSLSGPPDEAAFSCDVSTWDKFLEAIGSKEIVEPFIRHALRDACIEAGLMDYELSPYYENAR